MDALLAALATVLGTGILSMIGAFATGRVVPATRMEAAAREAEKRVEAAAREAEKWRAAYDAITKAHDQQARLLDRLQMSAEITDNVMRALATRRAAGQVGMVAAEGES